MQIYHCACCDQALYFENVQCVRCGHKLAYLPDRSAIAAVEPAEQGLWRPLGPDSEAGLFRLCRNYLVEDVCNWAVDANDENSLCLSCRLTRTIPNLSVPGHREAWRALEGAKRRLVQNLLALGLPLQFDQTGECRRLTFDFLSDGIEPQTASILTGHVNGVITVNVAEADDAEREKRRLVLHEPYRTLLGHLRHESGHFYWDQLIRDQPRASDFREIFGDERENYAAALERHYREGPPEAWQSYFVSAYAAVHAWEDWAETWAHYLHLTDTLDTARECGLMLRPDRRDLPAARPRFSMRDAAAFPFDQMIADWHSVAFLLNNLSRGLGQRDPYPFILSAAAVEKLRFVHQVCAEAKSEAVCPGRFCGGRGTAEQSGQ